MCLLALRPGPWLSGCLYRCSRHAVTLLGKIRGKRCSPPGGAFWSSGFAWTLPVPHRLLPLENRRRLLLLPAKNRASPVFPRRVSCYFCRGGVSPRRAAFPGRAEAVACPAAALPAHARPSLPPAPRLHFLPLYPFVLRSRQVETKRTFSLVAFSMERRSPTVLSLQLGQWS